MATIEGNEIALRAVAAELIPPVRAGVDARADQDSAGPPFITRTVTVPTTYTPSNPNTVAPGWVYGLCIDAQASEAATVYVAFGTASPSFETQAIVGQVIVIPRGARRVFLRSTIQQNVTITWFLDRYADKRYSPKTPGIQTITGSVEIIGQPVSVNVANTPTVTVGNALLQTVTQYPLASEFSTQSTNTGETNTALSSGDITTGYAIGFNVFFVNGNDVGEQTLIIEAKIVPGGGYVTLASVGTPAGATRGRGVGIGLEVNHVLTQYMRFRTVINGAATPGAGKSYLYWMNR